MKTKVIGLLVLGLLFVMLASAKLLPVPDQVGENSNIDRSDIIEKVGDNVIIAPPGLERRVFIHYAKPGTECGNGICEQGENAKKCAADCGGGTSGDSQCYDFLGRGVYWKTTPIDYVINPVNSEGLTQDFITNTVKKSVNEWNSYTNANLEGNYIIDNAATWDSETPDGRNELVFGNYSDPNTIGIAVVWGYYSGPPKSREIVEFDILFNSNFDWGDATLNSNLMDFENIATHELGHGFGLADLYEGSCIEETMYGYSSNGDIDKRSLNSGDIIGIQSLYGQ